MHKPAGFIPYPAAPTEIKEEAFLLRASAPAQASSSAVAPVALRARSRPWEVKESSGRKSLCGAQDVQLLPHNEAGPAPGLIPLSQATEELGKHLCPEIFK